MVRAPVKLKPVPKKIEVKISDLKIDDFAISRRDGSRFVQRITEIEKGKIFGHFWRATKKPSDPTVSLSRCGGMKLNREKSGVSCQGRDPDRFHTLPKF